MKPRTVVAFFSCALVVWCGAGRSILSAQQSPNLDSERRLAATVSENKMVETVRRLVGFAPRTYGSPLNHESAQWLAAAFRDAGLQVTIHQDAARDWYNPVSWQVRTQAPGGGGASVLKTAWPSIGSPSAKGEAPLSLEAAEGAVCLLSANPTQQNTAGCAAVLTDGRSSPSGWPTIGRLRGTGWTIPVFGLSHQEAANLRERAGAGEKIRVSFDLESKTGNGAGETVIATLPGKDHSKYVLFCAHGDSDSGGPGADDNASGVAIVLEIARAMAAAVRSGAIAQPAWDVRFAPWGGEMTSSREYLTGMDKDPSKLQAVFNFDQSGFGSSKDALYVEPDDVPVNSQVIAVVRAVMKDHIGDKGFPEHAASIMSTGGTDSYVFQNARSAPEAQYPAITIYTSAWGTERSYKVTPGFPPLNWYADEKPGMVTVDGDAFYHSAGDTPANTTDTEPFDMGWCARVGLISSLRLMQEAEAGRLALALESPLPPAFEGAVRQGTRLAAGLQPPRAVATTKPTYTREAMKAKLQGNVVVECVVMQDGTVGGARVVRSLDSKYGLDEEAINAVRKWRFEPGTIDGKPVPVIVTLEMTFRLRQPGSITSALPATPVNRPQV